MATAGTKAGRAAIDLSGAHIPKSDFGHADLSGANFSEANLNAANFEGATLRYADFSSAKLIGANFASADLSHANFTKSNLSNASVKQAELLEAKLEFTILNKADFKGADLRTAKGLSWYDIFKTYIDEKTTLPEYLGEEELLDALEKLTPKFPWRDKYAGAYTSLLQEFYKIIELDNVTTLQEFLMQMRIAQEREDNV